MCNVIMHPLTKKKQERVTVQFSSFFSNTPIHSLSLSLTHTLLMHTSDPSKKRKTGQFATTPCGQLDGEFTRPYGVAFDSKHKSIVVTDNYNHRLQFFSQQGGKFLSKFGSEGTGNGQLDNPKGVCIQPATNNVIVTDDSRLQVFSVSTSSGSSSSLVNLFTVGSDERGSEPSQFNVPRGICCTARGDIIVADCDNNRMQMIDCKGRHVRAFGSLGNENDQFHFPWGVCVQEDANRMIITDCYNQRLSVWSVDGCEPILEVPVQGYPQGICTYPRTHRIVVSCWGSNDIKVLDCKTKNEWDVIQQFGSKGEQPGQFVSPCGVCIDDRGVLIVADRFNDRVQMFC